MLFKRLHRKQNTEETQTAVPADNMEEETEEQFEERIMIQLKKQRRITLLKKIVLVVFVGAGLLGGYRSLAQEQPSFDAASAVNDYSFAEDYIRNYFKYPQDEESSSFLEQFSAYTVNPVLFEQGTKTMEVKNVNVYQTSAEDKSNPGSLSVYAYVDVETTNQEGKTEETKFYTKLEIFRNNGYYTVTSPVSMAVCLPKAISDDMMKGLLPTEDEFDGTDCTEQEKEEIANTIRLFLTTYVTDLEQAKLLMQDPSSLEPLGSGTSVSFLNLRSAKQNDEEIWAEADVRYEIENVFHIDLTMRFIFDKQTNKIISKEVC